MITVTLIRRAAPGAWKFVPAQKRSPRSPASHSNKYTTQRRPPRSKPRKGNRRLSCLLPSDGADRLRLLNVQTSQLEAFLSHKTPPYAILSHTWGDDSEELTMDDVEKGEINKPGVGSVKLRLCPCFGRWHEGHAYHVVTSRSSLDARDGRQSIQDSCEAIAHLWLRGIFSSFQREHSHQAPGPPRSDHAVVSSSLSGVSRPG